VSVGADGNIDSDFSASAQTSLKSNFGGSHGRLRGQHEPGQQTHRNWSKEPRPDAGALDEGSKQTLGEEWEDHSPTKDLLKKGALDGSLRIMKGKTSRLLVLSDIHGHADMAGIIAARQSGH
jgi:hypothetical protein